MVKNMDIDYGNLREYREQKFEAKIEEVHGGSLYPAGEEKCISVTHNGNQWQSIALTKKEAKILQKVISEWVEDTI